MKEKQTFVELRGSGLSFDKISKQMKRSKQTLIDLSQELSGEIKNYQSIELETLIEQKKLLKEHRIVMFTNILSKMRESIEKEISVRCPTVN